MTLLEPGELRSCPCDTGQRAPAGPGGMAPPRPPATHNATSRACSRCAHVSLGPGGCGVGCCLGLCGPSACERGVTHSAERSWTGGQGWAVSWALLLSPPPAALHPRPACVPEVLGCVFRSVGDSEGATSDPWRDPAPAPGNGAGKRCVRVSTPGPKRSPVWEAWRGVTEAGTRPRPGRSPQHAGGHSGKAGGATHASRGPRGPAAERPRWAARPGSPPSLRQRRQPRKQVAGACAASGEVMVSQRAPHSSDVGYTRSAFCVPVTPATGRRPCKSEPQRASRSATWGVQGAVTLHRAPDTTAEQMGVRPGPRVCPRSPCSGTKATVSSSCRTARSACRSCDSGFLTLD